MLRTKVLRGTLTSKVEGIKCELVYNEILRISFACFILKRAQAQKIERESTGVSRTLQFEARRRYNKRAVKVHRGVRRGGGRGERGTNNRYLYGKGDKGKGLLHASF